MKKWPKIALLLSMIFIAGGLLTACGGAEEEAPANDPGTEAPEEDAAGGEEAEGTEEAGDEGAGDSEAVAQGEEIVQSNCISCHGENLEGASGPSLHGVGDKYSEEELHDILVNGIGSMPGGLASGNEDAVVQYLLTLK